MLLSFSDFSEFFQIAVFRQRYNTLYTRCFFEQYFFKCYTFLLIFYMNLYEFAQILHEFAKIKYTLNLIFLKFAKIE